MKAITFDTFGGPEVLRLVEVPLPSPGPGQIRVQIRAAGVNPFDGKVRSGAMEAIFPTSLPAVPGIELAGVVDALGDGVTGVAVGDRVVGWADAPTGSYAEYALTTTWAPIPDGLDFVAAVTLPVAVETANRVLNQLKVTTGETLLVHGASGAVGQVAVQLAVARGVTVIGTAAEKNQDRVRALGAVPTGYGPGLVDRVRALAPDGVDAVFDVAGKGALPDSIELRGGVERIVTIADPDAFRLGVAFSGADERSTDDLVAFADRMVRGEVSTVVAGRYELARAADAHRLSDGGHAGGKVVLIP
ncbi:NADP-dependent oxidoreductase [Plantactinospora solaniradicis]|uniref:NADP-dependent oxidoreductase n=1 Tax=Plantactinospora solaniradicis TaxID=1723736 RepID=A0ABW1KNT8_9ACTN